MNKPIIALQMYTIRDFANNDLGRTLDQVKAMGYDAVELAGTYGLGAEEFKKHLDAAGLEAASAHVSIAAFKEDAAGTVALYKALGCRLVSIPHLPLEALPGGADFDVTKETIVAAAALCKKHDMVLGYHNHAFELENMVNGSFVLDALFDAVAPDMLLAQIDTGWVLAAGLDPVEYVRKYAGRCPSVHLKDIVKVGGKFEDRPVGKGSQDIPAVIKAAIEAGGYIMVVELDEAVGMTSLEAARLSREYLRGIGY